MQMPTPAIYEIRHTATGMLYVGSTNDYKRRFAEHRYSLRRGNHYNRHLQSAWKKYGEDAFSFSVLECLSDELELMKREQYWIDATTAVDNGFNMCPLAGSTRGVPRSAEHKAKISAANKGRIYSELSKSRIRSARAKQVISPESIEKTRAGNLGRTRTAEMRANISAGCVGKTVTPETRAKMSLANTGKKASDATKAKLAESSRGRVKSPETRAKLSAANLGIKKPAEAIAKRQATRLANNIARQQAADSALVCP